MWSLLQLQPDPCTANGSLAQKYPSIQTSQKICRQSSHLKICNTYFAEKSIFLRSTVQGILILEGPPAYFTQVSRKLIPSHTAIESTLIEAGINRSNLLTAPRCVTNRYKKNESKFSFAVWLFIFLYSKYWLALWWFITLLDGDKALNTKQNDQTST